MAKCHLISVDSRDALLAKIKAERGIDLVVTFKPLWGTPIWTVRHQAEMAIGETLPEAVEDLLKKLDGVSTPPADELDDLLRWGPDHF